MRRAFLFVWPTREVAPVIPIMGSFGISNTKVQSDLFNGDILRDCVFEESE